jgi:tRNA A-37 threonylcarbamoyl transferase component Bud32
MGVVLAAWHLELQQRVAVKVARAEAMRQSDVRERFSREARAAASLKSQHVVRVIDVGALPDSTPYMVMEYLDGNDLARELELRTRLPIEEAVGYVLQAIEALAEAHSHGIVHRDLKPANLFLAFQPDGSRIVKVLDFGISKSSHETEDLALTSRSGFLGSPLYTSPEQLRSSHDVDQRSDVWSLGVILYELLCGEPPFQGDSLADLVHSMLEPTPSVKALRSEVPAVLADIVTRCLSRDAASRFRSVAGLGRALGGLAPEMLVHAERAARVLGPQSLSERPPSLNELVATARTELAPGLVVPRARRRWPARAWVAMAAVGVVLLAFGVGARARTSGEMTAPVVRGTAPTTRAEPTRPKSVALVSEAAAVPSPPTAAPSTTPAGAPPARALPANTTTRIPSAVTRSVSVNRHPNPPRLATRPEAERTKAENTAPVITLPDFGGRR